MKVRHVEISLQLLTKKVYDLATAPEIMLGPTDVHFSYNSPAYIGEKVSSSAAHSVYSAEDKLTHPYQRYGTYPGATPRNADGWRCYWVQIGGVS